MWHSLFSRRPALRVHFLRAATILLFALPLCAQTTPSAGPDAATLARHNVPPTRDGIAIFLRTIAADGNSQHVAALIRQLGHDDHDTRLEATRSLRRLAVLPQSALRQAAKSPDLEISTRAQALLDERAKQSDSPLSAALRLAAQKRMPGLAAEMLAVVPLLETEIDLRRARAALAAATAAAADMPLLAAALHHAHGEVRLAAAHALITVADADVPDRLAPLLKDKDDRVALAAARALAQAGDRQCLPTLVRLLGSPRPAVRSHSDSTLRAVTGLSFDFQAAAAAELRQAAADAWAAWLAREGATAKLHRPLNAPGDDRGRTLVCVGTQGGNVFEIDLDGNETFQAGAHQPWACQVLRNGHRVVGDYATRTVVEYDEAGKIVWKHDRLPGGPMSVHRLGNGNTLLACSDSKRVVELSVTGGLAWEVKFAARPAYAWRLENGNTLVALHREVGRVVEIDRSGAEVWKLENLQDPQAVQRLANGNTLVTLTDANTVSEFDAAGAVVWKLEGLSTPADAQRLPNGNTLVCDQTGALTEYDIEGQPVWVFKKKDVAFSRLCRY